MRCVINLGLHSHEKALRDEAATAHALGMTYVHIPVDFQNPTERDFDAFCRALNKASDSPVHVHCIANYRVSAFFYRYRRTILGMDAPRARADLDRVRKPDPILTAFIKSAMVLKSGFRLRNSQMTSMFRWRSNSSLRLDRTRFR